MYFCKYVDKIKRRAKELTQFVYGDSFLIIESFCHRERAFAYLELCISLLFSNNTSSDQFFFHLGGFFIITILKKLGTRNIKNLVELKDNQITRSMSCILAYEIECG